MKRLMIMCILCFSDLLFADELLDTCEYARGMHESDNPIVLYPASVGGCVGHVAGYGVGLVLATPLVFLGAERGVEVIVAASGDQGNKVLNYIFGLPGSLILKANDEL